MLWRQLVAEHSLAVSESARCGSDLLWSPEIYIYDGANHAFANPSGSRYNPEAAEAAWTRTTAFLERYLKS